MRCSDEFVRSSSQQLHADACSGFAKILLTFKIRLLDVECTLCEISFFVCENKVKLILSSTFSKQHYNYCSISKFIIVVV